LYSEVSGSQNEWRYIPVAALTVPQRPFVVNREGCSRLTVMLAEDASGMTLIMKESATTGQLRVEGLTRRESEVLIWVARGKSNEEIALILNMSLSTVKKHLQHIFEKLGVESRTAAAAVAMDNTGREDFR
jgi:DNA-binding CsgD family transcriptional regulator